MTNYKALLPYAKTDRQRQIFDLLVLEDRGDGKSGAPAAVARRLRVTRESVRDVIKAVVRNAALAGYAPENRPPWAQELPEGHRVKGMSTRTAPDGSIDQQWQKTERAPDDEPSQPLVPEGHHVTRSATMLDRQGKALIQWVSTDHAAASREASFWEAARAAAASCASLPPLSPNPKGKFRESLTIYPIGDPHIGMLSWHKETGVDFDTRIAESELFACVDDLVRQAPRSRDARLVLLGDNFHAETDKQLTPKGGNKLDVDTRSARVRKLGLQLFLRLIVRIVKHHAHVDVHVLPGNHDPDAAIWTSLWLEQACKDMPTVAIADNRNPYQYARYGKVLLGFTHGDLAKDDKLLSIMSVDCAPEGLPGHETFWGETCYRHWFAGHIHHDTIKEYPGGIVEHVRTLAARDMWHHAQGYRSGRALQAITFDPDYGVRSRTVCDIRRVKNLLSASK